MGGGGGVGVKIMHAELFGITLAVDAFYSNRIGELDWV